MKRCRGRRGRRSRHPHLVYDNNSYKSVKRVGYERSEQVNVFSFVTERMSDHFLLSEMVWRLYTRELLPRRLTPPPYLCAA